MNNTVRTPEIRRPEAIDAEWMSQVLQNAGIDSAVSSAEISQVGTGQIGACVRLRLEYSRAAPRGPRCLIGKFPSPNPASFRPGIPPGLYGRDEKFDRDLPRDVPASTPKGFLAQT